MIKEMTIKGLELAEIYYRDAVSVLTEKCCPALKNGYAGGLIGYGSDVLGNDDELSRDHEWGPRCIIWLKNSDYDKYAAKLDRFLNDSLPEQFMGFPTRYKVDESMDCLVPVERGEKGMHHIAITTVARHLEVQLGLQTLEPDLYDWLCIPEQKLLELTRGRIFDDPVGEITQVRKHLAYFPDAIWYFKMLYAWESLHELDIVGLCAMRGEILSARLALARIIERIVRLTFLLNRKYCPGTMKWFSKEFFKLPRLADRIGKTLENCLILNNLEVVTSKIEEILLLLIEEHNRLHITSDVKVEPPHRLLRGQLSFSCENVIKELKKQLPKELSGLRIHGGCDQWITNDDVLIWAEDFGRFKSVYRTVKVIERKGTGDRMV
jgi:hypothetical protein